MRAKIYTNGIETIAGVTKGELSKKDFILEETIEVTDKGLLSELEEYGYCNIEYNGKTIVFAKVPAIRYFN
tara:strand:- start:245 stop:457 length:213 start_codon:yes stop_codon:yes gene_type:complete